VHWTYKEYELESDLQQGDFIIPTQELKEILLNDVNPKFCVDKYIGFVITTQSCDLARHGGKPPKAQYINIATVRSLKEVSTRLLEKAVNPVAKGVFPKSSQKDARDFLHRLFNQNEQAQGLFYFHPDADIELGDHSVAFLRVITTLKSYHYDALIAARRGRLAPDFQAKFGWLVGNLYSRAATPDWADAVGGSETLSSLENLYLEEQIPGCGPNWLEDALINAGRKNNVVFKDRDITELTEELEQHRPASASEILISEVVKDAKQALTPHQGLLKQNLELYEQTEQEILKIFREGVAQYLKSAKIDLEVDNIELEDIKGKINLQLNELKENSFNVISVNEDKLRKLSNRLKINGKLKRILNE
jgi:hypothetical protein